LQFEDEPAAQELGPGDYIFISAGNIQQSVSNCLSAQLSKRCPGVKEKSGIAKN